MTSFVLPAFLRPSKPVIINSSDEYARLYLRYLKRQWGDLFQLRELLEKPKKWRYLFDIIVRGYLIDSINKRYRLMIELRREIYWSLVRDHTIRTSTVDFEESIHRILQSPSLKKVLKP